VIAIRERYIAVPNLYTNKDINKCVRQRISAIVIRCMFSSEMVGRGADIATVQKMMVYADPATTAWYDRRGEEAQ
jgi:site-specific recombinase XerD